MTPFVDQYCCLLYNLLLSFSVSIFQAETSEDLYEWKTALEHALVQAPSAALVMGHNGIFRSDNDTIEGSFHQCRYLLYLLPCFFNYYCWSYNGGPLTLFIV